MENGLNLNYCFLELYGIKKGPPINANKEDIEKRTDFLRRTLGIFFYASLFYLIAYTSQVNFQWRINAWLLSLLFLILMLIWLYVLNEKKNNWKLENKDYLRDQLDEDVTNDDFFMNSNKELPKTLLRIKKPMRVYLVSLFVSLIVHLIFLIDIYFNKEEFPYDKESVFLSLLCVFTQATTYIYYRTYRSMLKYVFFNKNYKAILMAFDDDNFERLRSFFDITGKKLRFPILSYLGFGTFSNNITFLQITAGIGVINLLFLVYLNVNPLWAVNVNAIIILLSYFFFFYGALTILIKHRIYYKYSIEDYAKKNKNYYTILLSTFSLVAVILWFSSQGTNNLFTLTPLERTPENELSLKQYIQDREIKHGDTLYYIGCYGGGMKSNAWTLSILNKLYEDTHVFKKTVGISGASGGTMGLVNMATLSQHQKGSLKKKINKIATTKILSIDFAHAFGRDYFIHNFFPFGRMDISDRSKSAMYTYAEIAGFDTKQFNKISYREYWKKIYDKDKQFPILIANTTNITGRHGIANSVKIEDALTYDMFYNGADDILEIPNNKTLSYYGATSTSNRFPVLSPAARIKNLGQYNDGGIFENSAMLSAYNLYKTFNYITKDTLENKTVFINIVNDKNLYIRKVIDFDKKKDTLKAYRKNEIGAVIESVVATEMTPNYIKTKLTTLTRTNKRVQFKSIYLPHTFNKDDIQRLFGKEAACNTGIIEKMKANNDQIKAILLQHSKTYEETDAIIEPPMSRVMAKPAYEFMEAMLNHPDVYKRYCRVGCQLI